MSIAAQLLNAQWKLSNAKPGPITEWKRAVLINKFRGKSAQLSVRSEIHEQSDAIHEERQRIIKAHSQTLWQQQMLKQSYTELKKEQADLDNYKAQLAQEQATFVQEQEEYKQELKRFKVGRAIFDKSRLTFNQSKYDTRMFKLEYRERSLAKQEIELAANHADLVKQRLEFDKILTLQIANQQKFKEERRRFNIEKEAFKQAPVLATDQGESLATTQFKCLTTQALPARYLMLTRQTLLETPTSNSVRGATKHFNSK